MMKIKNHHTISTIGIALVAILAITLFGITNAVRAAEYRVSDSITVGSDEVIADDLFISGTNLQIDGVVEGDVYAAGQQITLNGTIEGDLIAAGSNITIAGDIGGSLRVAGQNLNILSSSIGGGVSFFGASLNTTSDSTIGNGLLFFGDNATVNGTVTHGLTTFGTSVTINGTVGTDSNITAKNLTINDGAEIAGDIEYRSDQDADVAEGAVLAGEINRVGDFRQHEVGLQITRYAFTAWSFLAALLTGAVLLLIARRPLRNTATTVSKRPLASFFWGLLALLATLPLGGLLMVTVIGIPLALLLWTGFFVGLYISKFIVGIALGKSLLTRLTSEKQPRMLYSFLLGLSALYLINLIPIVTIFASIIIASLGLGSIVIRLYEGTRQQYAPASKK